MAKLGFGKPSVDQLIALKVQGVSPDYAAKLHADGIDAASFNDLIQYRIFNVSPDFIAGMKAAGFGDIPTKKLVAAARPERHAGLREERQSPVP